MSSGYSQNGNAKGSAIYRGISGLGSAVGLAVTIMLTPVVFERSKGFIYGYLSSYWGHDIANVLTLVMGAIQAFVIYACTSLLLTLLAVCVVTAFAASRFSGR